MEEIVFKPIGFVKNHQTDVCHRDGEWADTVSEIVLAPELEEALDGIYDYSHILVFFWMDQVAEDDRRLKKIVPYGLKEVGPRGIFATRMPQRPNPIGVTIVQLLREKENRRERNVLEVLGLDAFNNTPVVDIKPYNRHPRDLVLDCTIPEWEIS